MTPQQISAIKSRISTDIDYAINFLLKNNFSGAAAKLAALGYTVTTPEKAFIIIKGFYNSGDGDSLKYVLTTPYLNGASNGTGGLNGDMTTARVGLVGADASPSDSTSGFDWNAGLDTLLNAALGVFGLGKKPTSTTDTSVTTLLQQQAAAQAAKTKQNATTIIVVVVVVSVVAVIITLIFKSNNKKS